MYYKWLSWCFCYSPYPCIFVLGSVLLDSCWCCLKETPGTGSAVAWRVRVYTFQYILYWWQNIYSYELTYITFPKPSAGWIYTIKITQLHHNHECANIWMHLSSQSQVDVLAHRYKTRYPWKNLHSTLIVHSLCIRDQYCSISHQLHIFKHHCDHTFHFECM